MKLRIALILLAVSALAASCASRGVIAERPVPVENEVYHLDTGDQLRVTVFGQADLSGDFAVDGTGAISMPLLPPIIARGLTTDDLEDVVDLIGSSKRKGNWDLKLDDAKAYLSLRVEFESDNVSELLRMPDDN